MPAASVALTNALDRSTGVLVAKFRGARGASSSSGRSAGRVFGSRFVTEVTLASGASPSVGFAPIPLPNWGPANYDPQGAYLLACKNNSSTIKLLARASIGYTEIGGGYVTLLNGWVVRRVHFIDDDATQYVIMDERAIMSLISITGRAVYDPIKKVEAWDDAEDPVMNNWGHPNKLRNAAGRPRFAPSPRYGFGANAGSTESLDEPAPGYENTQAGSWFCRDGLDYLFDCHFAEGKRPRTRNNRGNSILPPDITWGKDAASLVGFDRKCSSFNLLNMNLLDALQLIARKAGPYDIGVEPVDEWTSKITFSDMANTEESYGEMLYLADSVGTLQAGMDAPNLIAGGALQECVAGTPLGGCAIVGDPPVMELFCSTDDVGFGASLLVPAWSPDHETAFKLFCNGGSAAPAAAFNSACLRWPMVFCAYKINPNVNPFTSGQWAKLRPLLQPRIQPQQLTAFSDSSSNPRNWIHMSVCSDYKLEYEIDGKTVVDDEDDEYEWVAGPEFDGFQLSPDRTIIFLSAARAAKATWGIRHYASDGETALTPAPQSEWDGAFIQRRDIRLNIAVVHDTGIVGFDESDPNGCEALFDENAPRITYCYRAVDQDYVHWERYASYPIGYHRPSAKASTYTDWPDKVSSSALFRDWTPTLADSANRIGHHGQKKNKHFKRVFISGSGRINRLAPNWRPGRPVRIETPNGLSLGAVIESVRHVMEDPSNGGAPATWLGLATSQDATIRDVHVPMPSTGVGGGGQSGPAKSSGGGSGADGPTSPKPETPATGKTDGPASGGDSGSGPITTGANDGNVPRGNDAKAPEIQTGADDGYTKAQIQSEVEKLADPNAGRENDDPANAPDNGPQTEAAPSNAPAAEGGGNPDATDVDPVAPEKKKPHWADLSKTMDGRDATLAAGDHISGGPEAKASEEKAKPKTPMTEQQMLDSMAARDAERQSGWRDNASNDRSARRDALEETAQQDNGKGRNAAREAIAMDRDRSDPGYSLKGSQGAGRKSAVSAAASPAPKSRAGIRTMDQAKQAYGESIGVDYAARKKELARSPADRMAEAKAAYGKSIGK